MIWEKKKEPVRIEPDELTKARFALKLAEQNFNNAEPEFIEIAISELNAAKMKVDVLIKKNFC